MAEIERIDPRVIVALGATAGQAFFGSSFRVNAQRGRAVPWDPPSSGGANGDSQAGFIVVPTIHPSGVLRAGEDRDSMYAGLVRDLVAVRDCARKR
jgi:uracil-DNA glycosylase